MQLAAVVVHVIEQVVVSPGVRMARTMTRAAHVQGWAIESPDFIILLTRIDSKVYLDWG